MKRHLAGGRPHLYSNSVAIDGANTKNRDLVNDWPAPVIIAATRGTLRASWRAVEVYRQEALVCAVALHETTLFSDSGHAHCRVGYEELQVHQRHPLSC